jgi:hypothetical protein
MGLRHSFDSRPRVPLRRGLQLVAATTLLVGEYVRAHPPVFPAYRSDPPAFARQLRTAALGCYQLDASGIRDSSWRSALVRSFGTFRLHPEAVDTMYPERRRVSAPLSVSNDSVQTLHAVTLGWVADSLDDGIRVGRGDLFGGFGFSLAPDGARWSGVASYDVDVGPPFRYELGVVHATRITCVDSIRKSRRRSRTEWRGGLS